MITFEEAQAYLRIDLPDEKDRAMLQLAIDASDRWMISAVGPCYDDTDPKAKELQLMVIADLYDNRTTTELNQYNVRRLFYDLALQLRLELRGEAGC
ncbi:MAG: head-tail connector protein [Ruminococcus sp.]|nr:head-tail connector protein [Ruminococcus sp.]